MSPVRALRLSLIGLALALGGVALSALTLVYLSLMSFQLVGVRAYAAIGLVGALATALTCLVQARSWYRADTSLHDESALRASRRVVWLGYVGTLAAVMGLLAVAARAVLLSPLFWMATVGALLTLLGLAVGGVQHLRREGPAGTPGVLVRDAVARSNARADADLPAIEPVDERR